MKISRIDSWHVQTRHSHQLNENGEIEPFKKLED